MGQKQSEKREEKLMSPDAISTLEDLRSFIVKTKKETCDQAWDLEGLIPDNRLKEGIAEVKEAYTQLQASYVEAKKYAEYIKECVEDDNSLPTPPYGWVSPMGKFRKDIKQYDRVCSDVMKKLDWATIGNFCKRIDNKTR